MGTQIVVVVLGVRDANNQPLAPGPPALPSTPRPSDPDLFPFPTDLTLVRWNSFQKPWEERKCSIYWHRVYGCVVYLQHVQYQKPKRIWLNKHQPNFIVEYYAAVIQNDLNLSNIM